MHFSNAGHAGFGARVGKQRTVRRVQRSRVGTVERGRLHPALNFVVACGRPGVCTSGEFPIVSRSIWRQHPRGGYARRELASTSSHASRTSECKSRQRPMVARNDRLGDPAARMAREKGFSVNAPDHFGARRVGFRAAYPSESLSEARGMKNRLWRGLRLSLQE